MAPKPLMIRKANAASQKPPAFQNAIQTPSPFCITLLPTLGAGPLLRTALAWCLPCGRTAVFTVVRCVYVCTVRYIWTTMPLFWVFEKAGRRRRASDRDDGARNRAIMEESPPKSSRNFFRASRHSHFYLVGDWRHRGPTYESNTVTIIYCTLYTALPVLTIQYTVEGNNG
jgi:hypothetical protein